MKEKVLEQASTWRHGHSAYAATRFRPLGTYSWQFVVIIEDLFAISELIIRNLKREDRESPKGLNRWSARARRAKDAVRRKWIAR